jgi:hypothetical protein
LFCGLFGGFPRFAPNGAAWSGVAANRGC